MRKQAVPRTLVDILVVHRAHLQTSCLVSGYRLTLSSGLLEEYKNAGAKITTVDYGSPESLKNAITGADVVISTLNSDPAALQALHQLGRICKGRKCEAVHALRVR